MFTLIAAVYNVERYLEDFIASVEAQTFPLDRVQVVMVDDGSTDCSMAMLLAWEARRPELVTVIAQENAGQSSARNTGLRLARGTWVSFPDPDDMLTPGYLSEVAAFLTAEPDVGMVATRRTLFIEASGEFRPHPLDAHYRASNRVRNLDEQPQYFNESSNSAFFRSELLAEQALRFDERVRPAYEDGHLCVSYLLRLARPRVAFVSSASYIYRKRREQDSTLDQGAADPRRYTTQLERGYLDILQQAYAMRGHEPEWLQAGILYQLSWYFQDAHKREHVTSVADGAVAAEFHRLLAKIVGLLDPHMIRSFSLRRFDPVWRAVLLHSYDPRSWHGGHVLVDKIDTWKRLERVTYLYTGAPPQETFFSNGVVVQPTFAKTRCIDYFGRTMMFERIAWLPSGAVRVRLDGSDVDVRLKEPETPRYSLLLSQARATLVPRPAVATRERERARTKRHRLGRADRLLIWFAGTRLVRSQFANAWVLMDRVDNANDSAEFLFRYLRSRRRRVNAWFVIRKGTPDHRRLLDDGYKRIVPHGSVRWKLLMLNCRHLVSSHVDVPIHQPPAIVRLGPPRWRFTFLQHGVTKSDLSLWLNPKDLHLILTSTRAEHESIVGDGSPYRYTDREAVLTGLPRFDALLRAGDSCPPEDRDLILVAPTWRTWLTTYTPGVGRRTLPPAEFAQTEFAVNWLGLVGDDRLRKLAEDHGLRVSLLLHPDLEQLSTTLCLPEHVEVLRYGAQDVRATFARARALVTDYSSVAFDASYIDRPVVYFQFDRERVFTGEHVGRPGYFDYARDGFGPLTTAHDDAVEAIHDTILAGPHPRAEYAARIAEAFPVRDGRCTERAFRAIRASTRRLPRTLPDQLHPTPSPAQAAQTVERSLPSQ